ncbi:flavin-containing monooxygenase [Cytobacillus dafuensis]|uniref:Oxidoreductase n=1 Tax=Cytobacillus dafuensis TaxID=1742359 RepID=A0A5B8Z903_CYTDA|nr:NAD(P)/FAD-dependent oxidoreductase [Cytobacillus dafuensis]QED49430.1 oxidoreductase [Cytobacillus dafuensis]
MLDVVIIGAGQAGLAMGYWLSKSQKQNKFLIVDKRARVGEVWRERYDSLVLFTPRAYSSLPGLALKGNGHEFPTKDEIANYLENYAKHFSLPLQLETDVNKIKEEEGFYSIYTNKGTILSKQVVVASGPFHTPFIPTISKNSSSDIYHIHSSEYKNSNQLQPGNVLIVGGGNSGAQIAAELSETREVHLSVGQKIRYFPLTIFGKSSFWWFDKVGILKATNQSVVGKRIQKLGDPIFGFDLKHLVEERKVHLHARTITITDKKVEFENNQKLEVQNIIWATGFKADYSWIQIEGILNENGQPIHTRGITNKKGFYFLGLPWLHKRGSSLLLGVGNDAEFLFKVIDKEC